MENIYKVRRAQDTSVLGAFLRAVGCVGPHGSMMVKECGVRR